MNPPLLYVYMLTVIARWTRVGRHVALASVRIPLLHADAPIGARILAALGGALAAIDHQRAGHHRILHEIRRRIGQVHRRQTPLEAVARRNRRRQLGVHVLEHAAHIQNALQFHVHIVAGRRVHFYRVVHDQRVRFGRRPTNADRVPAIVVHVDARLVAQRDGAVAQIEDVVNVTVDEFDGDVVGASAAVVKEQAVRFECAEAEINEDGRVRFEHGQTDVRVLGAECGRLVGRRRWRGDETGGDFEAGGGQRRHFGAERFDEVDVAARGDDQI